MITINTPETTSDALSAVVKEMIASTKKDHKWIQARPNKEPQACKALFMGHHIGAAFLQTSLSLLFGKALRSRFQLRKNLGGQDRSSMDEPGRHLNGAIRSPGRENVSRKNRRRKQHHVNPPGFQHREALPRF
jgi:hypothetical protein